MTALESKPVPMHPRYAALAASTFRGRTQAVELFAAWSTEVYGQAPEPEDVTEQIASRFVRWCLTSEPPDIRYSLLSHRSPIWCPVWQALVACTRDPRRPPSMRDVFMSIPKAYREAIHKRGATAYEAGRQHMREFVRQHAAWIAQDPKGRDTFEAYVRARKAGAPLPEIVPWERIKLILKPRSPYSLKTVATMAEQLSDAWKELAVSDGEPWLSIARELRNQSLRVNNRPVSKATAASVQALFQLHDHRTLTGTRNLAVVCALVFWGLRATEIVQLKRSDIARWGSDGALRVRVESSTGGRERYLLLTTRMQRVLERMVILLQREQAEGSRASAAYASQLLEPDAPLFPATERWRSGGRRPPKAPLRSPEVYRIVGLDKAQGPSPTQIRRYLDQTMADLKVSRPVRDYLLRGRRRELDSELQSRADSALVMLEALISERAKIVW